MVFRILAVLLSAVLAGCGGTIYTDSNAVNLEPARLSHLRAPQTVTLINGVANQAMREILQDTIKWEIDTRQLIETAVAVLRRGLVKQGIRVAAPAPKTVTLRVTMRGASAQFVPVPTVAASSRVTIEADFGDGSSTWVDGRGGSAFGVQRAFEGAIQAALNVLLNDPQFVAYMNQ